MSQSLQNSVKLLYKNNKVTKNVVNYINSIVSKLAIEKKNKKLKLKVKELNTKLNEYKKLKLNYKAKNIKQIDQQLINKESILVRNKLRKNRVIYKKHPIIVQHPVIMRDMGLGSMTFAEIEENPDIIYVNENFRQLLKEAHETLYKKTSILSASIHFLYCTDAPDLLNKINIGNVNFRYTKEAVSFNKNINPLDNESLPINVSGDRSGGKFIQLGYKIMYSIKNEQELIDNNEILLSKKELKALKAYHPQSDRKFHEMTTASTTSNRLCIYETFLHIMKIRSLKYAHENKKNHEDILLRLKNEGKEIETAVKNGDLIISLELLTKKYDAEVFIIFYGAQYCLINDSLDIQDEDYPIKISAGRTTSVTKVNEIKYFENKEVFLYQKNVHVAPTLFKFNTMEKLDKLNEKTKFQLKQVNLKSNKINYSGILGFDTETYLDDKLNCVCYCITIRGELNKTQISKTFYGINSVNEFIEYIESITTKVDNTKARPKESTPAIYMYGFNNSRFDNTFIYNKFHDLDPNTKYVFTGSSIKYIKYNNIRIYDISLQYKIGSLRTTCKQFGLEKEKGVFPYRFVNKDNLYYKGAVPDIKYWNSKADHDEYIEKEGNDFDMKEYTEKYCLLDSELVYELALIHFKNSVGEINGRKYNVIDAPTSAKVSLLLFQQCFLDENLHQSKDKIIIKERKAYKGGRTEVFKKEFNNETTDSKLYYYDINSSYPSSMTEKMPNEHVKTDIYDNEIIPIDNIINHNLYLCKIEYIGTDKTFIPNILIRNDKGSIIACKNSEYAYHWGCELKEAMLNNCIVTVKECEVYRGKAIFKDFAEYMYNERLKVKKSNPALAIFYKTVMNSLYGKFGQKAFNTSKLCNDMKEVYKYLKGDMTILQSFEVINDKILIEYKEKNSEYDSIGQLCRFSSYIASVSRCKLSEFMRDVGHENVYYCDTDSVFTTKEPSANLVDQNKLGKWKLETAPIDKAVFLAPKSYYYINEEETVKKAKGVRGEKLEVENYDDLISGKVKKVPQKNDMFFRSLEGIKIENKTREIQAVHNKRVWIGNNSEAFNNIKDWENSK